MDKVRDAKSRGATRFKHFKPKLSSDILKNSEAKREKKIRKLSSVVGKSSSSNEDCEMESLGICRDEDELRHVVSKRKFFDGCNGVSHVNVPRRLRSAMTKRSRESTSPPSLMSKKAKSNSNIKKSKSVMKRGSERGSKRILCGTITKDEEEVAATLFALAGLFANSKAINEMSEGKPTSLEPKFSNVRESNDNPLAIEVSQKHDISVCSSVVVEAAVASPGAERLAENMKVESWNELDVQDGPKLSYFKKLLLGGNDSSLQVTSHCDGKPLCSSVEFSIPSDQPADFRSRHAIQNKASFLERKPETLGTGTPIGCQVESRQILESKKIGLALWPGLPLTTFSKAARADDQSLPASASKLPAWLDAACSGSRRTSIQIDSFAKIFEGNADRRLSKRCATHVYISRLIQDLRTSEGEEKSADLQSQMRTQEGFNQVVLSTSNNFDGVGMGVKPSVCIRSIAGANAYPSSNVADIEILHHTYKNDCLKSSAASAVSNWQKQSYDIFMSLARGDSISHRTRHGSESLSPTLQYHHVSSLGQHQFSGSSFSLPQPFYNSASSNHFPTLQQVQMQLQSHPSQLYSAQAGQSGLMKHHRHQQELHQRLWDAQLNAAKPTIQFLSLQSGPASPRPQQNPSMTVSPLPFSGKGFRSNALLPLQL